MSKSIGNLQGVNIEVAVTVMGLEIVYFTAKAAIDADGSGPRTPGDTYEPDTTLHGPDGKALNAWVTPFVVVPPLVCQKTKGVVLGSECLVTNVLTRQSCLAVVGDIGPHLKIGEISPACAKQIGVNPSPVTGGEDRHIIDYEIRVGKPATINGITYKLKPYRT